MHWAQKPSRVCLGFDKIGQKNNIPRSEVKRDKKRGEIIFEVSNIVGPSARSNGESIETQKKRIKIRAVCESFKRRAHVTITDIDCAEKHEKAGSKRFVREDLKRTIEILHQREIVFPPIPFEFSLSH